MIKQILRLLSSCRELGESEEQMVLAGYLIPSRLYDYVGADDVLVDEMVINSLIDVLCSMSEVSCKNKGIEEWKILRLNSSNNNKLKSNRKKLVKYIIVKNVEPL